ncbi:MAG TPA: prepilin-type N-terminal cleavage/methylation domain-containing protein [Candidatus Gastranaerophilaceae bacterium]|nr:prepilin-type N-terminal cleavage/methylation domain-containing protein [Candidatus Gastranaerophilaceae bacterium]HPT41934.1 prepilin-type N-terminal cleavage/methylation domain-containing protein [Candidatus Gastranaerophilaceae bacterium]
MKKRLGFTLAEVLITLGIIGVVAAMTIPTLMNQTGQAEFKTGLKKMISGINQAVTMNVALDSVSFSEGDETNNLYKLFSDRMNVISSTSAAVGTGDINVDEGNYIIFLNDGAAISWTDTVNETACTTTVGTNEATGVCNVLIDVNGKKRPNALTTSSTDIKDQFGVRIGGQQALPGGVAKAVMYNR